MNKRKTVFIVVIGAGIMAIIDRIRLHNKVEELEEKT
ncbi:conjugal transfer protein, partial [Clostridioides difficile]|nr:conjugal transfer protein [Clostridioides difficile]